MKLSKDEFIQKLIETSQSIDVDLTYQMAEMLYKYKELLLEWNKKMNLTAITDDEEIIVKHFIDCIELSKYIPESFKVIDVGTGAGMPGIILAIVNCGSKFTLIDALQKRITFLEEVVSKLNLTNVTLIHERAEVLGKDKLNREMYDIATSRAVAGLNILLELTVPFVKVNGKCIYMKSEKLTEELSISQNAIKVLNVKQDKIIDYKLKLGNEEYNHKLIFFTKQMATADKYSRDFAKIKKMPL